MPQGTNDQIYRSSPMALSDVEIEAVKILANARYGGNKSMATRAMIRHFVVCQFPGMGLNLFSAEKTVITEAA